MGLLTLNRVMSSQRDRRRRQINSRCMPIDSMARSKGSPHQLDDATPQGSKTSARRKGSPAQQDDNLLGGKKMRYSVPELPELPKDVWHDILSRLPLRDAAQAGCVSHTFLSSLSCRPNLTFSEETVGLNWKAGREYELAQIFSNRVNKIMRKHSGTGVKTFMLRYCGSSINASYLNKWLKIAITPGIEEITLSVPRYCGVYYNFPCPLLFNGNGNSIRHLDLNCCAFHPMAGLGCLARLHLSEVDITGDELGHLLSNSLAMEELKLMHCHKIISLKIPCLLHRLNRLTVFNCRSLQVIENKAPNVCSVHINGTFEKLRVGELLQVKELEMIDTDETSLVHHARAKLPFIMPNLETLTLYSPGEMLSTPSLGAKFLYLRNLQIFLCDGDRLGFSYDYFSLVYFFDACPVLEDFILCVSQTRVRQDLISAEDSHLRRMPEHRHSHLKNMKILGFCSAKSMVELTCHVLENATSLECLTLDAIYDGSSSRGEADRSYVPNKFGECCPVTSRRMIAHAHKGLWAIGRYVVEKVPSTVKLNVEKLCSHCHKIK